VCEIDDDEAVVIYAFAGDPDASPTVFGRHGRRVHAHVHEVIVGGHQSCGFSSRLVNILHEAMGWVRFLQAERLARLTY
jgi:hypothetical protein